MAETTIITIQITTDRSGTGTLAKETIKKRNELINRLLSGEIMDISYEEQTNTAYIAVKETQIENNVYKEKQPTCHMLKSWSCTIPSAKVIPRL